MILFPNAKINIGLNITEKRSDGFHNLETIFYPVSLTDVLEFVPVKKRETCITNTGIEVDDNKNNLCIKAYYLLKQKYDLPVLDIHLHKIIPIGAGLGGGSSDGAFILKALNEYFNLNIDFETLTDYVSKLGSDCPFFLHSKPLYASEKGDKFEETGLSLKGYNVVIIYPGIFVSTAEAYSGVIPVKPDISIKEIVKTPIVEWKDVLKNDFEESVFISYPEIKNVKEMLYSSGAVYASMSGSGSAVYGLFSKKPDLSELQSNYFVWEGILN